MIGEVELHEMRSDDLADGKSVHQTCKEDEGYEMVV